MQWDNVCSCPYNVYRGTNPQALTRIDQTQAPQYVDHSVQANTTYYYAVQSHDADTGLESDQSNIAVATVPK